MLSMLLAYNDAGDVIATLDYMVARDADGNVSGLIDFEAHEAAGAPLQDVWTVDGAVGSATWPEWLGSRAHDFTVRVDRRHKHPLRSLVHRASGHRRDRRDVESAIAARIAAARHGAADIRDIVGGPDRPLLLDDEGRTTKRAPREVPDLPLAALGKAA